jgi:hypothetical protein
MTEEIFETPETEVQSDTYVSYRTTNHPAKIVESASMAGIEYPKVKYKNHLHQNIIDEGLLSDLQLKVVDMAGQRHSMYLNDGTKAGFFIGDGTGIGKGRSQAGIFYDNHLQGRKKGLWVSISQDLMEDAKRDLEGIGAKLRIARINDWKIDQKIDLPTGIIFTTYSSLIKKSRDNKHSRLAQLLEWLGDEPTICFDECHRLKNFIAENGKPTESGLVGVQLQDSIPNARVIYSSATGATDVRNMGYMVRLGLWGAGTSFPEGFSQFQQEIEAGGIGAMEVVCRDMKALGMYVSRNISFEGVVYSEIFHELTPEQVSMYNVSARLWRIIFSKMDDVIKAISGDSKVKKFAYANFWSSHQRFYSQLITAFKVPSTIKAIEEKLAEGKSVVISLINTLESRTAEKVSQLLSEGLDLDELDCTPREIILGMLNKFPTDQYEMDEDGQAFVVYDKNEKPMKNDYAERIKQQLIDMTMEISVPENPLDQIINYFGYNNVAEITGRKKRLIKDHHDKVYYKKRAPEGVSMNKVNVFEMAQFQSGKKRIAIISTAAACGISLHADKNAINQAPRVQMTIQVSWSADIQMQSFGRTHRTNQLHPPEYVLLVTNVGGERRFASTIARRLSTLGALTKGQGDTLAQNDIGKYNFETEEGAAAVYKLYTEAIKGNIELDGIQATARELMISMGVLKRKPNGEEYIEKSDERNIPKFLNRILALDICDQNALFLKFCDIFDEIVLQAKANGTFQTGVVDLQAEEIRLKKVEVLVTDKLTKAKTFYYELETDIKIIPKTYEDVYKMYKVVPQGRFKAFMANYTTHNPCFVYEIEPKTDAKSGTLLKRYIKQGIRSKETIGDKELASHYKIALKDSEAEWNKKLALTPAFAQKNYYIIGGAILMLWHKLKKDEKETDRLRIVRTETIDKKRIVGIEIPPRRKDAILANFTEKEEILTAEQVYSMVYHDERKFPLPGNTTMFLRAANVGDEKRIELAGISRNSRMFDKFRDMGLFSEQIMGQLRFFVPVTDAPDIIRQLLDIYEVKTEVDINEDAEIEDDEAPHQFEVIEDTDIVVTEKEMKEMADAGKPESNLIEKIDVEIGEQTSLF